MGFKVVITVEKKIKVKRKLLLLVGKTKNLIMILIVGEILYLLKEGPRPLTSIVQKLSSLVPYHYQN